MPASLAAKRDYVQATPPGAARARALRPRQPDQWPGCPGALGRVAGQPARPTYHGFATLGQIAENVTGQPLSAYFRDHIFGPLA
jgi:CubicO group peptidase (beta-lactamase class C family)